MPFKYFPTKTNIEKISLPDEKGEQSENPFSPGYIRPHGKYYYPPEFFVVRKKIIEKFSGICFLCGEIGDEVHHIDYNKQNNDEENFCLLCKKCHLSTNGNRAYWTQFLKNKLRDTFK